MLDPADIVVIVTGTVSIIVCSCISILCIGRKKRRRRHKERETTSSATIPVPDVEREGNAEDSVPATVRRPEEDPSIPAYTSADTQPLSPREQELVTRMNVMAERIRELEERSRLSGYQGTGSSQLMEETTPQRAGRGNSLFIHPILAFQISLDPSVVTVGVPVIGTLLTNGSFEQIPDTAFGVWIRDNYVYGEGNGDEVLQSCPFKIALGLIFRDTSTEILFRTDGESHAFQAILMGSEDTGASNSTTSTSTGGSTASDPSPASSTHNPSETLNGEPTKSPPMSTPSSHTNLSPGIITGISVGAAIALILVALLLWLLYGRRKKTLSTSLYNPPSPTPFIPTVLSKESIENARLSQADRDRSTPDSPAEPVTPRSHFGPRAGTSREVIQHSDSGWRPPVESSEGGHRPVELPPTYDDSTRRVSGAGDGGNSGALAGIQRLVRSLPRRPDTSVIEEKSSGKCS
ncbi:hypothetical protein L218DRAFT_1005328 [Marasmius fiardii PR-910]|nr:hypothetical protein L218DRAFT_1005328 [Marasmius fiardii PR-910]